MRKVLGALVGAFLLLAFFIYVISALYSDWLWYSDLGYEILFWKPLINKGIIQIVNCSVLFVFIATILFSIRHAILTFVNEGLRKRLRLVHDLDRPLYHLSQRIISVYIIIFSLLLSFLISLVTGFTGWLEFLTYLHSTPFELTDPIFQKDLSFYVFKLPFFLTLFKALLGPLVLITILITVVYFFTGVIRIHSLCFWREKSVEIIFSALRHLSILMAFLFLFKGFGYYLDTYQILYSQKGLVHGASYRDIHGTLPFLRILSVFCFGGFLGAILAFYKKSVRLLTVPLVLLLLGSSLLFLWPSVLQSLVVVPNELELETPYLENQIEFTRFAYGLDKTNVEEYPGNSPLNAEALYNAQETLANIPFHDPNPILQVYNQSQSLGQYYEFRNIYSNRYQINGQYHQVMVAPRELDTNNLESSAKTFINTRFKYTHGFGVVASFINSVTSEGLPNLIMKDVPLTTNFQELQLLQPRIYFGVLTNEWVIVNTDLREFDYPMGNKSVGYSYNGETGIFLTPLNRFMLSIQHGTPRLYLAKEINSQSRILLCRNILERVEKLVPFLQYDEEPYLVIDQGRLKWIVDAFTTSDTFPYSNMYPDRGFNYIRNSVKVVVDAYDGTVDFYSVDPEDPILQTYEQIFPGVFKSLEEMPDNLRSHLRYPKSLFIIQSNILRTFHMTDPVSFYNKEDSWDIAQRMISTESQSIDPYYTIMKLPGHDTPEFVLLVPYTTSTNGTHIPGNMRAWLAARMDNGNYGELNLYVLPKNNEVKGSWQIERRIDQDPTISEQLALCEQRGSRVISCKLRVLPLGGNFLYIEPVYIQSEKAGSVPKMRNLVVAYDDKIVMSTTLEDALYKLFALEFNFSSEPILLNAQDSGIVNQDTKGTEANLQMLLGQIIQLKEMIEQLEEQVVNIYSEMLESGSIPGAESTQGAESQSESKSESKSISNPNAK